MTKTKDKNKGVDKKTKIPAPPGGLEKRMSRDDYEAALDPLQLELSHAARWLAHTGKRLVVLVEGRDTAGKGGVINAISEHLNPRQCHVVALDKPSEQEARQWYFQRYVAHLPVSGQMTLFDRSWYNRAGVESVMGFADQEQVKAFLEQAPVFEQLLVDDGIVLFKYWLTVDQPEQEQRFMERLADPLKRWKLSPIDVQARERYDDYTRARERMLKATHTAKAPWTLVDFNDQRRGRLTLIRDLLDRLPDSEVPESTIEFPPLKRKLLKERFEVKPKPITSWRE
ncbi:polyphosphate kinase 2 [soil metagenome]